MTVELPPSLPRPRTLGFYAIALCAPLWCLVAIHRYAVNCPYADDWGTLYRMFEMLDGKTTIAQFLWHQHNEHRVPFVKLIILASAFLFRYDTVMLTYLGFAFRCLTLVLLWDLLRLTLPPMVRLRPFLTAVTSLLLFSNVQFLGWIWYFPAIQWNLAALSVVAVAWALARWPGRLPGIAVALLATVIGSLTVGGCLSLWGIGLAAFTADYWLRNRRIPWLLMTSGVVLTALAAALYFHGYTKPAGTPSIWIAFSRPFDAAQFFTIVLGGAFSPSWSDARVPSWSGAIALLLVVLAVVRLSRKEPSVLPRLVPWLALVAVGCAIALLSTMGRLGMGRQQALMSHYVAISALFWSAVITIVAVAVATDDRNRHGRLRRAHIVWISVVGLGLMYGYVGAYYRGYRWMVVSSRQLKEAKLSLLAYEKASDDDLRKLHIPSERRSPLLIRTIAPRLREMHWGPFADVP